MNKPKPVTIQPLFFSIDDDIAGNYIGHRPVVIELKFKIDKDYFAKIKYNQDTFIDLIQNYYNQENNNDKKN
jgi:hypothetical protein